jgi:hypothetical protein
VTYTRQSKPTSPPEIPNWVQVGRPATMKKLGVRAELPKASFCGVISDPRGNSASVVSMLKSLDVMEKAVVLNPCADAKKPAETSPVG